MSTDADNFFDCTFADKDVFFCLSARHDHRHAAAHEIKRNFINLAVCLVIDVQILTDVDMFQNRDIEQVLEP